MGLHTLGQPCGQPGSPGCNLAEKGMARGGPDTQLVVVGNRWQGIPGRGNQDKHLAGGCSLVIDMEKSDC